MVVKAREIAGTGEDGRDLAVTVKDRNGRDKTVGAEYRTRQQAGRTSLPRPHCDAPLPSEHLPSDPQWYFKLPRLHCTISGTGAVQGPPDLI